MLHHRQCSPRLAGDSRAWAVLAADDTMSSLRVESEPAGAVGIRRRTSSPARRRSPVRRSTAGVHRVRLVRLGYLENSRLVTVKAGTQRDAAGAADRPGAADCAGRRAEDRRPRGRRRGQHHSAENGRRAGHRSARSQRSAGVGCGRQVCDPERQSVVQRRTNVDGHDRCARSRDRDWPDAGRRRARCRSGRRRRFRGRPPRSRSRKRTW